MGNQYLRMDKVQADTSALTMTYYNTYVQHSLSDTDFSFMNENLPKIVNQLCSGKNSSWIMSHGVRYIFIYRDKDGKLIGKPFVVSKSNCKKH